MIGSVTSSTFAPGVVVVVREYDPSTERYTRYAAVAICDSLAEFRADARAFAVRDLVCVAAFKSDYAGDLAEQIAVLAGAFAVPDRPGWYVWNVPLRMICRKRPLAVARYLATRDPGALDAFEMEFGVVESARAAPPIAHTKGTADV